MTTEYDPGCSLCRKDKLAEQPYSDNIFWETICPIHGQPMLVLNRHAAVPSPEEINHIREIAQRRHPGKKFRGYIQSMPQHWHEHLI